MVQGACLVSRRSAVQVRPGTPRVKVSLSWTQIWSALSVINQEKQSLLSSYDANI